MAIRNVFEHVQEVATTPERGRLESHQQEPQPAAGLGIRLRCRLESTEAAVTFAGRAVNAPGVLGGQPPRMVSLKVMITTAPRARAGPKGNSTRLRRAMVRPSPVITPMPQATTSA